MYATSPPSPTPIKQKTQFVKTCLNALIDNCYTAGNVASYMRKKCLVRDLQTFKSNCDFARKTACNHACNTAAQRTRAALVHNLRKESRMQVHITIKPLATDATAVNCCCRRHTFYAGWETPYNGYPTGEVHTAPPPAGSSALSPSSSEST